MSQIYLAGNAECGRDVGAGHREGLPWTPASLRSSADGTAPALLCCVRLVVILGLDSEDVEGVVAVVEIAAGVGDVGSSGEAEGADRKVAEGREGSGRGAGA